MHYFMFCFGFFICTAPQQLSAQHSSASLACSEWMVEESDAIEGTFVRRFTDMLVVPNATDSLAFDLKQFNEVLVISVILTGAGDCLDETSKMVVQFVSGTTLVLPMDGKFNCDREFAAFFSGAFGKKKEFRMLLSNQVHSIRIETRKSVVDKARKNNVEVTLNPMQQQEFRNRLACLVGE